MRPRLESVWVGKDPQLLDTMLDFYAPEAERIVDVCCNARRIWRGSRWAARVTYYDADPAQSPHAIADWGALPESDGSVDVLVYDPPHLPAGSVGKTSQRDYRRRFGLDLSCSGYNIGALHPPFLREAQRALCRDGLVFAKIKDYVHNHCYQQNLALFQQAAREAGLTPCDLIIKVEPGAGRMMSGRWKNSFHAKNVHVYWCVLRKGRCEPRSARR